MAKKWVLGCVGVVVGGGILSCVGGALLLWFAPEIMVALFTEDAPTTTVGAVDPATRVAIGQKTCAALNAGTATLTADELTQLLNDGTPNAARVRVQSDGGSLATFDLSTETEPGSSKWFNVHGKGAIVMEHGWFTHFTVDEMTVGGWDLGQYTRGQDLTMQANQNLAQQRAQKPQDFEALDAVERVAVEDGKFVLTMAPGTVIPACQGR